MIYATAVFWKHSHIFTFSDKPTIKVHILSFVWKKTYETWLIINLFENPEYLFDLRFPFSKDSINFFYELFYELNLGDTTSHYPVLLYKLISFTFIYSISFSVTFAAKSVYPFMKVDYCTGGWCTRILMAENEVKQRRQGRGSSVAYTIATRLPDML